MQGVRGRDGSALQRRALIPVTLPLELQQLFLTQHAVAN